LRRDRFACSLTKPRASSATVAPPWPSLDVTSDVSVATAVAAIIERFGRIDAVINNARNGGTLGYWASLDAAYTQAMFDVHVFGMERVSRAVLPTMLAQGAGTIVNIASTVGWVPMPMAAANCAAKAAVLAFSQSLHGELAGRGITVMIFAPPHMSTDAGKAWPLDAQVFTPEWAAEQLLRTLRRGRLRFLAGGSNRLLLAIQRLSPGLAARIMRDMGLRAGAKALARSRSAP
jgi:short-subunit dehydrogenase